MAKVCYDFSMNIHHASGTTSRRGSAGFRDAGASFEAVAQVDKPSQGRS
jgi:hypothetical protein